MIRGKDELPDVTYQTSSDFQHHQHDVMPPGFSNFGLSQKIREVVSPAKNVPFTNIYHRLVFCFTYCKGNSSIFMKYHPESRDPVDGQKSGDHQLIGKISHYLCTGFHTCQVVQDFFHQQYILGPKDYTDRILLDSGWDWIPKNPGGAWILRDMTPGSQTSYTKNNENPSKFYQQHLHQV